VCVEGEEEKLTSRGIRRHIKFIYRKGIEKRDQESIKLPIF
jgi:hypothetical protein